MAAQDGFYVNPVDGRPLVRRVAVSARRTATAAEVATARRKALELRAKGYSAAQIARGLTAAGPVVTTAMVEAWFL
jgi:hypothetical protein